MTAVAPGARAPLRSVVLPREHGGWNLTLEPVLLGLLASWSWAGLLLGAAAFVGFLARTPLDVVLVDRFRRRHTEKGRLARRVLAVEAVVLAALVAGAALLADGRFWLPLVLAAPLVVAELSFDMRSRARRLVPELAGAVGIASVAAAIGLAGGLDGLAAGGLWAVLAARSAAAIPYVRVQLARWHERPHRRSGSDLAQVVALAVVLVAWALGAVAVASVAAMGAVVAMHVGTVRLAPQRAVVLGVQQTLVGLAVVVVAGLTVPT